MATLLPKVCTRRTLHLESMLESVEGVGPSPAVSNWQGTRVPRGGCAGLPGGQEEPDTHGNLGACVSRRLRAAQHQHEATSVVPGTATILSGTALELGAPSKRLCCLQQNQHPGRQHPVGQPRPAIPRKGLSASFARELPMRGFGTSRTPNWQQS